MQGLGFNGKKKKKRSGYQNRAGVAHVFISKDLLKQLCLLIFCIFYGCFCTTEVEFHIHNSKSKIAVWLSSR